jgi:hypothetical protein
MKARYRDVETIYVTDEQADMMRRRCEGILRASTHNANVLDTLMLSCYQQGLVDGAEIASRGLLKSEPPTP